MATVFNKINWQVFSTQEKNYAIEEVKNIIAKNGGFIINFNLFSDLALSLTIEIEEKKVINLYQRINNTMEISEPDPEKLDSNSDRDWWIFMNISFGTGTGDMKVEIPNVPG